MKLDIVRTAAFVVALAGMAHAAALGTAFTYQGQLLRDGSPTTGTCEFQFSLFDSSSGGTQLGSPQPVSPVTVTNGVFDVQLNGGGQFGANAFTGGDRWLQIAVRCPVGVASYTTLAPRQQLTATPYALYAPTAGSAYNLTCNGCVSPAALAANAVTDQSVASGISYSKLSGAPAALPPSGAAGGSLSGTYPNPIIQTGAVGTLQLRDNAVTGAKVADGSLSTADIDFTTGNINLAESTTTVGTILKNGSPFIHNFGSNNTFMGVNAGNLSMTGDGNTGVGSFALQGNTTGRGNTAVGLNALVQNVDGSSNTAVGEGALQASTGSDGCTGRHTPSFCCTGVHAGSGCGGDNTAVGSIALNKDTTGSGNTAVGYGALISNTTGGNNVAVGTFALGANTTGSSNIAVGGSFVLSSDTTGARNVAVGDGAIPFSTTGSDNIAVGSGALHNANGNNNIAIGSDAGLSVGDGDDNIDIGNEGTLGDSSSIRIGGLQTTTFIAGIFGATSSSGTYVLVNADGQLGTITSSARFKEDIHDMGDSTSALLNLRPVRFRYKRDIDPSGLEQYGLVAEEVAKVYPDLVVYDDNGQPQTVRYHFVNAMLLNEVQKQARRISEQTQQISEQAQQVDELRERLATLEAAIVVGR